MQDAPNNPASNRLGPGLSEGLVAEAVRRSGYPLQLVIGEVLRSQFYVRDEWPYLDGDSRQIRTIDLLAEKRLYSEHSSHLRVRPRLQLIIECKQSDLPYVFFLSPNRPSLPYFPLITGLFTETIVTITDNNTSTWHFPIISALRLGNDDFLADSIPYCMSFAKASRKGRELELTGTDTFNSLVLPLVKSLQYSKQHYKPPNTAIYHDCNLILAVADAPMVGVNIGAGASNLIYVPWVRVVRGEVFDGSHQLDRERLYALDLVHKDFFQHYISNHVTPFAERFSTAALAHHEELATGLAFAKDLSKWPAEPDIQPCRTAPKNRDGCSGV